MGKGHQFKKSRWTRSGDALRVCSSRLTEPQLAELRRLAIERRESFADVLRLVVELGLPLLAASTERGRTDAA